LGLRERPAAEITRTLIDRIGEFTGGRPPEDDRTVVVVKYLTDGEARPADPGQRWSDGARITDPTIRPPS